MHIRFVTSKAAPEKIDELREVFTTKIFPALRETPGCLFAGLIESATDPNEFSSFTLWDDAESIRAYEDSGRFAALSEILRPYQAESDEWQLQMSDDLTLEYKPVVEEPKPQAYRLCTVMDESGLRQDGFVDMHLRLLRLQVRRDGFERLRQTYVETVFPALSDVEGCRNAFLLESTESKDKLLSVTVWDSEENARSYDRSPLFRSLMDNAKELMSADVWQTTLKTHLASRIYVNEDEKPGFYDVLAGTSFRAARKPPDTQASGSQTTRANGQDSSNG